MYFSYVAFGGMALGAFALGQDVKLPDLDQSPDLLISAFEGEGPSDRAGSVSGAGDVNGDGLEDFLIGAPGAEFQGDDSGRSYLIFGGGPLPLGSIPLSRVGMDIPGVVFDGTGIDSAGVVSGAGDVNGDGLDDILVTAPGSGGFLGKTFLIYGGLSLAGRIDLQLEVGSFVPGATISGTQTFEFIVSAKGVGDVNGDGLADILVGAFAYDSPAVDAGRTALIYGQAGSLQLSGDYSIGNVGTTVGPAGARFDGTSPALFSGASLAGVGDLNGDGLADFSIGAYGNSQLSSPAGRAYVVYGKEGAAEVNGAFVLEDIGATVDGFVVAGGASADSVGSSIDGAGDVNGDGIDDLLVGGRRSSSDGQIFLIFGRAGAAQLNGVIPVSSVGTSVLGTVFQGSDNEFLGTVAGAGDVNGDGLQDLLLGAPNRDRVYLVYGQAGTALVGSFRLLSDVGSSLPGLFFEGFYPQSALTGVGWQLASAGDLDGDGRPAILIGATTTFLSSSGAPGRAYLVRFPDPQAQITTFDRVPGPPGSFSR